MSFLSVPSFVHAGRSVLISPDGSGALPADLAAEYAALVLLEPEPTLQREWIRRLEEKLGVTRAHRKAAPPRPVTSSRPWAILGVTPHMERKVAETLREEGLQVYVPIETYLPKTANVARAHQPWKPRTRPLIPGYVFALLETERDLDIARANHAVRLMCRHGKPITVPALGIGTMILYEAWGEFDQARKTMTPARIRQRKRGKRGKAKFEPRWERGQRVRIRDEAGPLAGHWADVFRDRGDGVVDVLVSLFGRATNVVVDEAMIEGVA